MGKYLFWQPSDEVRTDHAIVEGGHVASDYDSMIAKLVAHGKDREDARTKLIHALENTVLLGVKTNRTFLQNCLAHENFAAGRFTTEFIDHHQNTLFDTGALEEDEAAVLAAALIVGPPPTQLPHGFDTPLRLVGRNTSYQLFARALRGGRCEISDLDRQLLRTVTIHHVDDAQIRYTIDGTEQNAWLACDSTILHLQIGGTSWRFEDTSRRAENYAETHSDGAIRAIMSGRVMSIAVDAGQWVEEGQQVLVVEAMKMHHTHNALSAGRVDTLHVEPGDQVEAGQILLEIAVEPQNADLETD